MGMAASQARFLSLTARKNNVEYEGQQINQQRTALSNASASHYTDLLGMAVPVCPSVEDYTQTVYSFNDGSLQNSITSIIARDDGTYNVSYLSKYNDDFSVIAAGATSVVNDNGTYMIGAAKLRPLADELYWSYVLRQESMTYRLYEDGDNFTYTDKDGVDQTLIPATYDIVTSLIGPEPQLGDYDVGPLIENYKNTQCYSSVTPNKTGMYHLEHNLCRLIWSDGTTAVTSSDGVTLTKLPASNGIYSLTGSMGNQTSTDQTSIDLQAALKEYYPDLYQRLVDTYIDSVMYLDYVYPTSNSNINKSYFTLSSNENAPNLQPAQMHSEWTALWNEISRLDHSDAYDRDHRAWQEKYDPYAGNYLDAKDYTKIYNITERQMFYDGEDPYLKSLSSDQLERLYYEEVAFRDMLEDGYGESAEGWYVRYKENTSTGEWEPIFYRGDDLVDGIKDDFQNIRSNVDTYKVGTRDVQNEVKGQIAYMEQDSTGRYINITFVENGVKAKTYALSTNTITDSDAYNDAMNQYEYDKALYDKAIEEINAKIAIIQAEDKNLELRLKQLDTEQNAISNELDAVQKVIEKSVESGFKTFG